MKIKMTRINEEKFNRRFNLFILGGMTLAMAATTAIQLAQGESGTVMLLVAAFGSLMGVLSTVFSANARILTFLFGFFDVTIYGIMCFMSHNYGNGALHLVYFLPMQFIGFWQWRRRGAGSHDRPRARRLGGTGRMLSSLAFLAGLAVCYFILWKVSGSASPADSSANGRMVIRYIDGDSLMANYNLAKEISEAMLLRSNQLDSEQQKRGAEITRFGNEIQNKYQNNGYLTQESFNADQAKLQQMQVDAQNYMAKLQRDAQNEMQQYNMQLNDSVENFINEYAKLKGYDMIIYKASGVYMDAKFDVTKEVVDGLNKRYTKVEKK